MYAKLDSDSVSAAVGVPGLFKMGAQVFWAGTPCKAALSARGKD